MKGYRWFIGIFLLLLALYIIIEATRTDPVDWTPTLSKEDKNPYGSYILYDQLKDIFPGADIQSNRLPVYNQLNEFEGTRTAYILVAPALELSWLDVQALMNYARSGNYVFISTDEFGRSLVDSMKLAVSILFSTTIKDSNWVHLTNPYLHPEMKYVFRQPTMDTHFSKYDTARSTVMGKNYRGDINFIKMPCGKGAFFIHSAPLCFSNYFMLTGRNREYISAALSYIPAGTRRLFWDEYYKSGPEGSANPLRFVLSNPYLKWSFRLAVISLLLYVFFEMKRRQRIIPVIEPLKNTTLDFVQTVGNVYFNQRDNKNIAEKRISHFLEFLRSKLFMDTRFLNDEFTRLLAGKAALPEQDANELMNTIHWVRQQDNVSDAALLQLNHLIDNFYKNVK